MEFDIFGYHVDYFVDKKFIGSIKIQEKDRENVGYAGRKQGVAEHDIVLGKKKIKKGTAFYTELFPLCGRVKTN